MGLNLHLTLLGVTNELDGVVGYRLEWEWVLLGLGMGMGMGSWGRGGG